MKMTFVVLGALGLAACAPTYATQAPTPAPVPVAYAPPPPPPPPVVSVPPPSTYVEIGPTPRHYRHRIHHRYHRRYHVTPVRAVHHHRRSTTNSGGLPKATSQ